MSRRTLLLCILFGVCAVLAFVERSSRLHSQHEQTVAIANAAAQNLASVKAYLHAIGADDLANDDDASDFPVEIWPQTAQSPEQIFYAQDAMVRHAVAQLAPPQPNKVNLYLLAFAGDAEENVFLNEVQYVAQLFDQRFDSRGHSLILANNPQTLARYPLATLTNLETAAKAMGAKMDRERDILLVFLTSHGSPDHLLYVSMEPLPLDQIAPNDLAEILAASHVTYKVVVISACYSGGFIDAIKSPTTLVITAARKDRSSFGCGTDSPITDFGRAFFVNALNQTGSFTQAFTAATKQIDAWETQRDEKHSYPQIASAPQIQAQLTAWRHGIQLGAAILFNPDEKAQTNTR